MEVRAVEKYVRISPSKLQLLAELVKDKEVDEAMDILKFIPREAARIMYKAVGSAIANAERNHGLRRSRLYISELYVGSGPTLKRFRARAMGRPGRIKKRTSHITVVLAER
jgi:large subunit ribosomal protein L22